jgi:hemerythrin-like metal-binding protein
MAPNGAMSDQLRRLAPVFLVVAGLVLAVLRRDAWGVAAGVALAAAGGGLFWRLRPQQDADVSRLDEVASRLHDERESRSLQMLVPIRWSSRLECGHPLIDEQHRRLFEIGGRLIHAAHKGMDRKGIETQLDTLISHIQVHFRTEEEVMARTRFPLTEEHCGHHHWLLQAALALRERYHTGEALAGEIVAFITEEVITEHILREDLKFALRAPKPAPPAAPAPAPD